MKLHAFFACIYFEASGSIETSGRFIPVETAFRA
jgi:hypothetical protein